MYEKEYNNRVMAELEISATSYNPLSISTSQLNEIRSRQFQKIGRILTYLSGNVDIKRIYNYIMSPLEKPFKICQLHGLPKLHKSGNRMRLIFPFRGHPLGPLHHFLAKCLEPVVLRQKTVISHVMEVIDALSGKSFPKESTICTADISAMYPNVDRKTALKIAQRALDTPEFQCFRMYSYCNCRQLLEVAHETLEFQFMD